MKKLITALMLLTCINASAQFPTNQSSETINIDTLSEDWDDFDFRWSAFEDQRVTYTLENNDGALIVSNYFFIWKMSSQPSGGSNTLYINKTVGDIQVGDSNCTFSINHTNRYPNGSHRAELLMLSSADTNITRSAGRGMVRIKDSLYDDQDGSYQNPSFTNLVDYLTKVEAAATYIGLTNLAFYSITNELQWVAIGNNSTTTAQNKANITAVSNLVDVIETNAYLRNGSLGLLDSLNLGGNRWISTDGGSTAGLFFESNMGATFLGVNNGNPGTLLDVTVAPSPMTPPALPSGGSSATFLRLIGQASGLGDSRLAILANDEAHLDFGDDTKQDRATIWFDSTNEELTFTTLGTNRFAVVSDGTFFFYLPISSAVEMQSTLAVTNIITAHSNLNMTATTKLSVSGDQAALKAESALFRDRAATLDDLVCGQDFRGGQQKVGYAIPSSFSFGGLMYHEQPNNTQTPTVGWLGIARQRQNTQPLIGSMGMVYNSNNGGSSLARVGVDAQIHPDDTGFGVYTSVRGSNTTHGTIGSIQRGAHLMIGDERGTNAVYGLHVEIPSWAFTTNNMYALFTENGDWVPTGVGTQRFDIDNRVTLVKPPSGGITNEAATVDYVNNAVSSVLEYHFYGSENSSGPTNYFRLDRDPSTNTKTTNTFVNVTNNQHVMFFITDPGEPGITELLAGIYQIHMHISKSGSATMTAKAEIYKVDAASNLIEIAESTETPPLSGSEQDYDRTAVVSTNIPLATTDRLAVAIVIQKTGVPSTDINVFTDLDADSFINVPVSGGIFVNRGGDTMTGTLTLADDPTAGSLEAATASYSENAANITNDLFSTPLTELFPTNGCPVPVYRPRNKAVTLQSVWTLAEGATCTVDIAVGPITTHPRTWPVVYTNAPVQTGTGFVENVSFGGSTSVPQNYGVQATINNLADFSTTNKVWVFLDGVM